jgi:hypothetical protein
MRLGVSYRAVLTDANLLLLSIVGSIDKSLIPKFDHTSKYSAEDYDLLNAILLRASELLTTPHILTEVSNLSGKLRGKYRLSARQLLASYIVISSEMHVAALGAVSEPTYERLGVTDAVLMTIKDVDVAVLTDDFDLYAARSSAGLPVWYFGHVRTGSLSL